jgi:hypothetical protein
MYPMYPPLPTLQDLIKQHDDMDKWIKSLKRSEEDKIDKDFRVRARLWMTSAFVLIACSPIVGPFITKIWEWAWPGLLH